MNVASAVARTTAHPTFTPAEAIAIMIVLLLIFAAVVVYCVWDDDNFMGR